MGGQTIIAIFAITFGIYGLIYPDTGRVWGTLESHKTNSKKDIEKKSKKLNQLISVFVITLGVLLLFI